MSEMRQMTFNDGEETDGASQVKLAEESARWDDGLDLQTREFVQQRTDEIHGQMKRTAEGIIKIGQNVRAVKERLARGAFLPWLKAEFEMSQSTAYNFMAVAEKFGEKLPTVGNFSPRILYALATATDQVIQKVEAGEIPATLEAIKVAKEAEKSRADDAERAKHVAEQQLQQLVEEVATLQRQLSEQPRVIEKTVENPQTQAALARLREKYAEIEARLVQKTERVKVLSEEISKYDMTNQQERYNEQIRYKWRQACDAFHLGVKQGITHIVTPLDAASAFGSDDWARLSDAENTLKRALEALSGLRESISSQFVEGSVES